MRYFALHSNWYKKVFSSSRKAVVTRANKTFETSFMYEPDTQNLQVGWLYSLGVTKHVTCYRLAMIILAILSVFFAEAAHCKNKNK